MPQSSTPQPSTPVSHRTVLGLALPIMLANATTPLLGLVDLAVVGRLGGAVPIGAVALGSLVFTLVFWGFNFLRMATTGLTAQAVGGEDHAAVADHLGRAAAVALIMGGVLVLAQRPISAIAFAWLDGSIEVEQLAASYVGIRMWSAPATLANYALMGWFIGLGRTKTAFSLQLLLNLTNIVLDLVFVLGFDAGVRGVAAGSMLAEVVAACVGGALAWRVLQRRGQRFDWQRIRNADALRRTLLINVDIMIRSLSLISVFVWFTAQAATFGDVTLAATALLMQLVNMASYVLDGLAYATETLTGRAIGARDQQALRRVFGLTSAWAGAAALALTAVFLLGGPVLIQALTPDVAVRAKAMAALPWAACVPIAGVAAFQLDGLFIGATWSATMRNAMVGALVVFAAAWFLLRPWGIHGLWAALYVHYGARTLTLLLGERGALRRLWVVG